MTRYYAIDAANARLVDLGPVLEQLRADRDAVARMQEALTAFQRADGSDDHARELAEREAAVRDLVLRMRQAVTRIDEWDITLRDIATGLVDFPALANGRPIWLCWRLGEQDVGWWHDLDSGVAGRKPLIDMG